MPEKRRRVNLVDVQGMFERLPGRKIERMRCPTKGKKRCQHLDRMQRGECTPENCVQLEKKIVRHSYKRARRALELTTGTKVAAKDGMLHPKSIPWKDRKILRKLSPSFDFRTHFRPNVLKQQLEKNGKKLPRLSTAASKRRYNREVVVIETTLKMETVGALKEFWQLKLKMAKLLQFRVMNAHIMKQKQVVSLQSNISEYVDESLAEKRWKECILRTSTPELLKCYQVMLVKIYIGKGKKR